MPRFNRPTSPRRCASLSLALFLLLLLPACSGYHIRGAVIPGHEPIVLVVDKDDARLRDGLVHASIEATLDPQSLDRKHLGKTVTDHTGQFALPVSQFGAGMIEYDLQIIARRQGFAPTVQRLPLPPSGKRVLIYMAPGQDRPVGDDILQESLKIGRELE